MKNDLIREKFAPSVLTVLLASIFYFLGARLIPKDNPKDFLTAVVSIASITVGFIATMKAILFSIEKRRVIGQLKDAGYYKHIISYLMSAIRWSFVLAVVSGLCLLIDFKKPEPWHRLACTAWVAALVLAIGTYYRVIRVFGIILKSD